MVPLYLFILCVVRYSRAQGNVEVWLVCVPLAYILVIKQVPLPVKVKRPCQPEALTAVSFRVVGRPIDGKLHPKNIAHTAKLEFSLHPPENRDSLGVLKI